MATRQRAGSWQADFMLAGRRFRETFDTEAAAKAWEFNAREALELGRPVPAVANGRTKTGARLETMGELLTWAETNHWRNNPKVKDADSAIACARLAVAILGKKKLVSEVVTEDLTELVHHELEEGNTPATADRKLAAISKLLHLAVGKGLITTVPRIPLTRETGNRIRWLTQTEAQALLKFWLDTGDMDLWSFTVFALHCGARKTALLTVDWRDFGPDFKTVLFRGGDKKSPPRTLPLSRLAITAVQRMHKRHGNRPGPFVHLRDGTDLRSKWDAMRDHFEWPDVTLHVLRHTCATWMLEKTGNLKLVQEWLGHRTLAMTLLYAKLVPGTLIKGANVLDDVLGEVA